MRLLDWLRGTGGENDPLYECRSCGTALDENGVECPYCGPTDVVRFDLGR
jgi:rubrerythrin